VKGPRIGALARIVADHWRDYAIILLVASHSGMIDAWWWRGAVAVVLILLLAVLGFWLSVEIFEAVDYSNLQRLKGKDLDRVGADFGIERRYCEPDSSYRDAIHRSTRYRG